MSEAGDFRDDAQALPGFGEDASSFFSLLRQALADHRDGLREAENADGRLGGNGEAERIGRFEIMEVIGRGGYGTVLRVRDPALGCERAMKVPNPETLTSPPALARFMDEARKAAMIDHPNVVRVVEADDILPLSYIVMEYCPGGSLGAWLAARPVDQPISPRWAAALVAEIADGVQAAHHCGLLHRDLKPGNIMLVRLDDRNEADSPRFHPKVGDFGLAKAIDQAPGRVDRTATGAMIGTLAYMSPEQARGERSISEASDIYGLGAILYEVLTRSKPFSGSSEAEVLGRILDDSIVPSPRAVCPGVPRDLDTICRTALAKRPGDRYRSAAELADDLRRFLRNDAVKGSPVWKRARASVRRNRLRITAATILIAVVLGSLIAWRQFRELKRRGETELLLHQFESASVAQFAELFPKIDLADPAVANRIRHLFGTGTETQKLGAALVMAPARPEFGDYCYRRLLASEPSDLARIARLLAPRMPDLPSRLSLDLQAKQVSHVPTDAEFDQRMASAACALVALGDDRGWAHLKFSPDPQVRSFSVHLLGPAGVEPELMVERLTIEPDVSIRRALIQALGEVPLSAWTPQGIERLRHLLVNLYTNDPDPGIHASAKWLLRHRDMSDPNAALDARLAGSRQPTARRWRIGPTRLTMVTIDDPAIDRVIEISDCEITVEQFLAFRPAHVFDRAVSSGGDFPINGTSYVDAAAFCNWLGTVTGLPPDQLCYHPHPGNPKWLASVAGYRDRLGFRLPEVDEARIAGRAGTVSRCFFGSSEKLSKYYGWALENSNGTAHSVARLKPNDVGLFDVLGNVAEWCEQSAWSAAPKNQALIVNSFVSHGRDFDQSAAGWAHLSAKYFSLQSYGFRVARTVRLRRRPAGT